MSAIHNDAQLFEELTLEATAAGLNRKMIQNKRDGYRKAFSNFNPAKVAKYTAKDVRRLMKDKIIIKNRLKIMATISNAQRIMEIKKEFGSFDKYIWKLAPKKKVGGHSKTAFKASEDMSKTLKKKGFKFTGPMACHIFMYAAGMLKHA